MRLLKTALFVLATTGLTQALPVVFSDDFESGLGNWTVTSNSPPPAIFSSPVHGGVGAAGLGTVLGNGETPGDASMFHLLTALPALSTLDFWVQFETEDSVTFDWSDAYIQDSSGNILQTLYHTAENTPYQHLSFDLSAYAGQDIRIAFLGHGDDAEDATIQYIDDLTVTSAASGTPEPVSGALCLFGLGAMGIAGIRRRRRSKS